MRASRLPGLILAGLLLGGCAGVASPPGPEGPPDLLPLDWLFANSEDRWGYQVSPDGTRLGWIATDDERTTIFFETLGTGKTGVIDTHSPRSIGWFTWAQDSRRVLFSQDQRGDENYHLYLASTERPEAPPVDLTPWPGVRARLEGVPRRDTGHVVVGANRRDRAVFDLYRVSLDTGEATLIAENPGDVVEWMIDRDGRPRARLRHEGAGTRHLEIWRAGEWSRRQTYDLEEWDVEMLGMTPEERGLWLVSSRGRDRRALVRLDVETGAETVVHEHPHVDVWATLSERTSLPLAAFAEPDYPEIHVFDRDLARDIAALPGRGPRGIWILGRDDEERRSTVQVHTDRGYRSYLLERDRPPRRLGESASHAFIESLAPVTPITVTSRDGERLHGYLTRPAGFRAPGPLVLHVHGGHWIRDSWHYDPIVQFFANRGYAVLQVNYRGSTGYGRRFAELAVGEYAGKMHDDLVDAVRWAVREGIADPARVAIHGGSYGGYAALVGMTFTPEVFACGVSVVGVSNLVTFFDAIPPYWKLSFAPRFLRYVGDPHTPEGRRRLEERSPLFRADRVRGPVLLIHGANDPRVSVRESEQMDAELRRLGKDVRLVVFPDEGHRRDYGNWRNAVRHYGEIERFLARCLGGRVTPEPAGS
jgi:dipeptidyl aminopeptidase/acylaminoacyl peptidase